MLDTGTRSPSRTRSRESQSPDLSAEGESRRGAVRGDAIWPVTIARGPHPFPSRTRSLSLAARMVLPGRPGGRVRRRRPPTRKPRPLTWRGACRASIQPTAPAALSRASVAPAAPPFLHSAHGPFRGHPPPGRARGPGGPPERRQVHAPECAARREAEHRDAPGADDPGERHGHPHDTDHAGDLRGHAGPAGAAVRAAAGDARDGAGGAAGRGRGGAAAGRHATGRGAARGRRGR
jgi:translation initiation factor IF-2